MAAGIYPAGVLEPPCNRSVKTALDLETVFDAKFGMAAIGEIGSGQGEFHRIPRASLDTDVQRTVSGVVEIRQPVDVAQAGVETQRVAQIEIGMKSELVLRAVVFLPA